jgi:hypothetical protein
MLLFPSREKEDRDPAIKGKSKQGLANHQVPAVIDQKFQLIAQFFFNL